MKVIVYTSSRADFGHLKILLKELSKSRIVKAQLLIIEIFIKGEKYFTKKILNNVPIPYKYLPLLVLPDKRNQTGKNFNRIFKSALDIFIKEKPKLVVVLGDRFETFAVAIAAYMLRIDIAHIHGGEISFGSLDQGYRDSITQLSKLHFVSTKVNKDRVESMVFSKQNIYNFGALAVENTSEILKLLPERWELLSKKFNLEKKNYILLTFHPVTTESDFGMSELKILIQDLKTFGLPVLATSANSDYGGWQINQYISKCFKLGIIKGSFQHTLGLEDYVIVANNSYAVVGNSSSILFETSILNVLGIDFGKRQVGRIAPKNIVRVSAQKGLMLSVLQNTNRNFKSNSNFYGNGQTARKIVTKLEKYGQ